MAYTYDAPGAFAKGRLAGIARHGETIAYEYDRFGRMTKDGVLTYGYDGNGNRTTIGYPGGVTATYTYAPKCWVTSVQLVKLCAQESKHIDYEPCDNKGSDWQLDGYTGPTFEPLSKERQIDSP